MEQIILVTGATGTVGKAVVQSLLKKTGIRIKVAARNKEKLNKMPWLNQVQSVYLNYDQPETLENALLNADKLFLMTPPGSAREVTVAEKVLSHVNRSCLKHIVRLSAIEAAEDNLFSHHALADKLLLSSPLNYTALRPNAFMQNLFNYLTKIKIDNAIDEPAGEAKTSFIDVRDIAEVAATILTEQGHENKIYNLTGGESLGYNEVASLLSDVLGREIHYQPITIQQYIQRKVAAGLSNKAAHTAGQYFDMLQAGKFASVSPVVRQILNRNATPLKQFIVDHYNEFKI